MRNTVNPFSGAEQTDNMQPIFGVSGMLLKMRVLLDRKREVNRIYF
jgi:hypothetical protein